MSKEQLGTTTPIFNKLFYNSRGQLAEIRESTSYMGPTDTTWDRGAIINHYSKYASCSFQMVPRGKDTRSISIMKLLLSGSCLILLLGFVQCNRRSTNPQSPLLGQYELRGYDETGKLAFTGTISMMSLEQDHLKGQCTIAREKYAPEGLFEQNGGCEGLVDGKKVSMDLAPSLDDAGLLLEGEFGDGRITGVWMLDGFVTSEPLGKFEAVKKK